MSGKTLTLLGILAFVVLVVVTFIWFIASWGNTDKAPVTGIVPAIEEERQA